jgi:hypothetical protein
MKFVYDDGDLDDDMRIYNDLEEFLDDWNLSLNNDNWCYLYQLNGTQEMPSEYVAEALNFIVRALIKQGAERDGLIQFSVTDKETNYQEWLDAISGVPGHSILTINRTGPARTVYLCTFPLSPTL